MSDRLYTKLMEFYSEVCVERTGMNPEMTIQVPYNIRMKLLAGCHSERIREELRGRTSFTLHGINIEPTKNETEQKLREKLERAKRIYEEAQEEYNTIIGGTNG